jgi:hypothetical protein
VNGSDIAQPPYAEVQDAAFAEGLTKLKWERNNEFGGLVLQGKCPVCKDDGGIDVFVPVVIAQFKADQEITTELVACTCSKNHGAPAGKSGCGRWGYVKPSLSEG